MAPPASLFASPFFLIGISSNTFLALIILCIHFSGTQINTSGTGSGPRKYMVNRNLDWLIYCYQAKRIKLGLGRCDSDSSWHKVVAQLLKILPVLTWENVPVEGNAVADVMMQTFEKHGRNNAYKDSKNLVVTTKLYWLPIEES